MHPDCLNCKNNLLCLSKGFTDIEIRFTCVGCGVSFYDASDESDYAFSCWPARVRGGWNNGRDQFDDAARLVGMCWRCKEIETTLLKISGPEHRLSKKEYRKVALGVVSVMLPKILEGPTKIKRGATEALMEKIDEVYEERLKDEARLEYMASCDAQ